MPAPRFAYAIRWAVAREWHRSPIMWIEAILTREDLLNVFRKLSPLEIQLGDGGTLNLSTPTAVCTVQDRGMTEVQKLVAAP